MPNEVAGPVPTVQSDEPAWQALGSLIAGRIADGLAGGLSTKSVDEIVENELGYVSALLPSFSLIVRT